MNTGVLVLVVIATALVIKVSAIPWAIFATLLPVVGATRRASNFRVCRAPTMNGVFASFSTRILSAMVGNVSPKRYALITLTAAFDKIAVILKLPFFFKSCIASKISVIRSPAPVIPQASLYGLGIFMTESGVWSVEFFSFSIVPPFSIGVDMRIAKCHD